MTALAMPPCMPPRTPFPVPRTARPTCTQTRAMSPPRAGRIRSTRPCVGRRRRLAVARTHPRARAPLAGLSLSLSEEVVSGGALGWQRDRGLVAVLALRGDEPVVGSGAGDGPVVVVEQHVVVAAEEHPVDDICLSAVAEPLVDVVRFGPGRRPIASGPQASAVSGNEGDFLAAGEQSLLAADVQAPPSPSNTRGRTPVSQR